MLRPLLAIAAAFTLLPAACKGGDSDAAPNAAGPQDSNAATCSPALAHAAGETTETLTSGGIERRYILRVPPAYGGSRPAPLVFAFHGYATSARFTVDSAGLAEETDERGWIAVFPDGTGTPQRWNVYDPAAGADDVRFVRDLLVHLEASLCLDPARVFAAGHSNGGGMALRFACDVPQLVASVAPIGATYIPCQADVPMIAFHGAKDPIVPYEGGLSPIGGITLPPVHRATSEWARGLGCDGLPIISRPAPDLELSTYRRCTHGDGETLLYTVLDGGHAWPAGAADTPADVDGVTTHSVGANELMLDFFEAHSRGP
jgi:polyhydroxybutyrate depolymerase